MEKELVMGRDRVELGLASRPSSSWPRPVLNRKGQERQREGEGEGN